MSKAWHQLFYHLVWSTAGREPLIPPAHEADLHRYIGSRGTEYGYNLITVNGMPDHIHVVGSWPPKVSVSEAAQKLKGSSSHFMQHLLGVDPFRWQQGYGAVSVTRADLDRVIDYVRNQKAHHRRGDTQSFFERSIPPSDTASSRLQPASYT